MKVQFDLFNRRRISSLILCNPNGEEMFSMPMAKERDLSMSLNELSELTFELPKYVNKDLVTPYYDLVKTRRIIKLEEVGQFIITKVEIQSDGITESKKVTCKGLEFELSSKNLDLLEGTYALYNPANTSKSLLHIISSYIPTWTISEVDSELWDIWRTFDIKDNNIYNFLMSEVQEAFDCVFMFDTFKRTIKVVKTSNLPKKTDIFMSNRNLMKELEITEDADNIITALDVYGDGELSIRTVNPLGTATIYDFSYFATTEWMTEGLVKAVLAWQEKVKNAETQYAELLILIKNQNSELANLKNDLANLNMEKNSLEQKHALAVVAGDDANCSLYFNQIESKKVEISNKENQITAKDEEIKNTSNSLLNISKSLSFENNFTVEQIKELNSFIYQASIQNTNFSTTSLTTIEEQREIMYDLYEWGKKELKKSCQPIWEFSVDAVNFLNLIQYKDTSNQLDLGSEIIIEVDKEKDLYATALLLGYSINLDEFDDLNLEFSNVLRFNSASYTFEELFNSTASISKSFDFESYTWDIGKQAYSMIDKYMNSALDLTTQEIKASDNQEFVISNVGIRGKEYFPSTDTYSNEQIWITKNVIAFSDDSFNTTKTALGKVTLPDGTKAYGLIGEYIVGKLLAGKTLVLENEKSTFRVDGEGVYIKDANIIMTSEGGQELSIPELIAVSTEKIDNVLTSDGKLDTTKMQGQILAGTNNIFCVNSTNNKALLVNDTGILISNKKANGNWVWTTAISADGISAEAIQANGTLSGVNIVGGSLNVGNGSFTVDGSGNVSITKGTINMGNGSFTVNNTGDISITKGSINIGDGAFSVDRFGNVVARSLSLKLTSEGTTGEVDANNLVIKNLVVGGNVTMGANATISWENVTGKGNVAQMEDLTWSNIKNRPTIPTIPTYITSTKITQTSIESPSITGGRITGAMIESYSSYGSGVTLDDDSVTWYDRNVRQCGIIRFDNSGAGSVEEASNRLLIESLNGYAMKIKSSGNMSLEARGGKIYIGSDVAFSGNVSGVTATFG